MQNTKEKGVVNFVVYRDSSDSMYTAVCLDFDIVEQGDDLEELKKSIEAGARLHLESVVKNDLNDGLLNRSAPKKYWKKLYECMVAYEDFLNKKNDITSKQKKPSVSDVWNRSSAELVVA